MIEIFSKFLPSIPLWSILLLVVILYLTYEYRRKMGLPPGPYGIPFFGYIVFLDRNRLSQQTSELCKKYNTDVLSMTWFGNTVVVLNTHELVKEVFQKRADFADRNDAHVFNGFDPDFTGVIATSGKMWKEARRFSISVLKDFGMGRIGAEEGIQNESRILVDLIKSQNGKVFNPNELLNVTVANVICGMVFGQRFEHGDPELCDALNGINGFLAKLSETKTFFALRFKIGRFIFSKLFEECHQLFNQFSEFVKRRIAEHKETYDGEVTDLIYAYLKEMEQGHHPDVFDDKMLESLIIDYFIAGSETTYSTLRWGLLAMAAYPEIQRKMQEELDQAIGERTPSMSDKKMTPYTEAFICEIQRHYTLVPMGGEHSNLSEDTVIQGYKIPKEAVVYGNQHAIHHDPKKWKNPSEFDPENFLEHGKVVNTEKLVAFGVGRRSCAGESLARVEIYLFLTSLVKEFEIKPESDDKAPDLVGQVATIHAPKPYKLRMKTRY